MGRSQLSEDGLIAVTWTGLALGLIFASLRIVARSKRMNRLLADDYLVLFALALLLANAILHTLQAPHLYYMIENPSGPDLENQVLGYTYYQFAVIAVFWSVLWSIKGSFLALYYLLFDGLPLNRRAWYAVAVFTALTYVGCWLGSVFTCHPPSDYFKYGQCTKPIDRKASLISVAYSTAADIVTDLMVMALPMNILWKAKLSLRQKLGLTAVFCLGFFIIAMAIVRAVEVTGKTYSDPVALAVWGIAESSVSVIVGCLPPFKSLLAARSRANDTHASSGSRINVSRAAKRSKRPSLTSGWGATAVPLQTRSTYRALGENQDCDTQVTTQSDGRGAPSDEDLLSPSQGKPRDIMMVQEFSVVRSDRQT